DLGHEDVGGACGDRPPQVVGGVRYARRGFGLPPEFEDHLYIFRPARPDGQATRRLLGHHRPRENKKPAAGAACHRPLLVPTKSPKPSAEEGEVLHRPGLPLGRAPMPANLLSRRFVSIKEQTRRRGTGFTTTRRRIAGGRRGG